MVESTIITDPENKTISGKFHIERGRHMKVTIEINNMSPHEFSNIHELVESIGKELVFGIAQHAVSP